MEKITYKIEYLDDLLGWRITQVINGQHFYYSGANFLDSRYFAPKLYKTLWRAAKALKEFARFDEWEV